MVRLFCCRAPAASGYAIAAPPSSVIITPFHVFHLGRDHTYHMRAVLCRTANLTR
jgi:hypothetical protein